MTLIERFNQYAWIGVLKHLIANGFFTTTSGGSTAVLEVAADAGLASGITHEDSKTTPVVAATAAADQAIPFSSNILRVEFKLRSLVAWSAIDIELRVVVGYIDAADLLAKLGDDELHKKIQINEGWQGYDYPDAGGAFNVGYAVSAVGTNTVVDHRIKVK